MRINILKQLQEAIMHTKAIQFASKEPLSFKDKFHLFFNTKIYSLGDHKILVYGVGKQEYLINQDGTKTSFRRVWI